MVNLKDKNGRSLYFSNRKEYYRRKRISQTLKNKYSQKKKVFIQKELFKRERQQVVFNAENEEGKKYGISIRVLIINGEETDLNEMEFKLLEVFKSNPQLSRLPFQNLTEGVEKEFIDAETDKGLSQGVYYCEINIRGNSTLFPI